MANRYDLLHIRPALTHAAMPPALEALAEEIVHSGLLRISTDDARNFVYHSGSDFDRHFSYRQLHDPKLLPQTRGLIADTLPGSAGKRGVEEVINRLQHKLKISGTIPHAREMEVARLLTQACEPVILQLALLEGVAIFVSYAHSVAELQPVHFWESLAGTGGLQSVSGDGAAVYISCGGHPFITSKEQKTFASDGFPALARMLVIGGQELGHYADLKRDAAGRVIGRHSAELSAPFRATDIARNARLADIARVADWKKLATQYPIVACLKAEAAVHFYRDKRPKSPPRLFAEMRARRLGARIRRDAATRGHALYAQFPRRTLTDDGSDDLWATQLVACLEDMQFNLTPVADAYRSDDPQAEEAILCVEALARVPQQVNKWGHTATQLCMPHLYQLYYHQVIPACITAYEARSGKKYVPL